MYHTRSQKSWGSTFVGVGSLRFARDDMNMPMMTLVKEMILVKEKIAQS